MSKLDLSDVTGLRSVIEPVPARGEFVGVEWEMGRPCAKIHQVLSTAKVDNGSKVSIDDYIWFALDRQQVIRIDREQTIEQVQQVTIPAAGGPGGNPGAPGMPGQPRRGRPGGKFGAMNGGGGGGAGADDGLGGNNNGGGFTDIKQGTDPRYGAPPGSSYGPPRGNFPPQGVPGLPPGANPGFNPQAGRTSTVSQGTRIRIKETWVLEH